jgi:hypothetical protein
MNFSMTATTATTTAAAGFSMNGGSAGDELLDRILNEFNQKSSRNLDHREAVSRMNCPFSHA